jgi:hypothetical protein
MAETKNAVNEATVGFAEESRDYVNRVTGAWTEAAQRWVNAAQQFVPTLRPEGFQVPNPKDFIDASYDIVEQALGYQRQLVHEVYDRFGTLVSTDQQPVQEKVTDQVNQAKDQAAAQARRAQA